MAAYATLPDLKTRMDIGDTIDDARLTEALESASREIDAWCDRRFDQDVVATARLFRPVDDSLIVTDDFYSTTGLVVATDPSGAGSYATTWAASDYQLEPLNGVRYGQPGWPFDRIVAVGTLTVPTGSRRPAVKVTAMWGWPAVPANVREACLIIAAESFKLGDAPFGVAGFGEFGPVRVRMNSRAQQLLDPYRRLSMGLA